MVWFDGFSDLKAARERVETAFYAPLGMMSPLWLAFGAAASAGAALWWMTRLAKPVNVEASMAHELQPVVRAAEVVSETIDAVAAPIPDVQGLAEAVVKSDTVADDLMQLIGVGPKIALALAERGVERFEQLAAWSNQDLAAFDAALGLRGRAIRSDFVAQARRLATGEA